MRRTLQVLQEFEHSVCTFTVIPKRDKVIFRAQEAPAIGELTLTKREALNLLNEMIDLINEEFDSSSKTRDGIKLNNISFVKDNL